jgi:hypothetical protein
MYKLQYNSPEFFGDFPQCSLIYILMNSFLGLGNILWVDMKDTYLLHECHASFQDQRKQNKKYTISLNYTYSHNLIYEVVLEISRTVIVVTALVEDDKNDGITVYAPKEIILKEMEAKIK